MRIEHIVAAVIIALVLMAFIRYVNRTEADKAKPSLAVRAVNAAGGNVEATRTLPAMAELAGRAAGATGRKVASTSRTAWGAGRARAQQARAARRETRAAQGKRANELGQAAWDGVVNAAAKVVGVLHRRRAGHGTAGRGWRWRWNRRSRGGGQADDKPETRTPHTDTDAPETDAPEGEQPKQQRPSRRRRFWRWGRGRRADRDDQPLPEAGDDSPDEEPSPPLTHTEKCQTCGDEITATIPAGENAREVVCGRCGTRLHFFRRSATDQEPTDVPQPTAADTTDTSTDPQEETMTAPTTTIPAQAAAEQAPRTPAPSDWGGIGSRVAAFEPESDADLINFMSSEIAGMCAYSDGYEALFETCTRSLGLDQRSVAGLGEFGERVVALTEEMARAHKRFVVIYEEVMKAVADGTVMPYNGRFFTGEVQV